MQRVLLILFALFLFAIPAAAEERFLVRIDSEQTSGEAPGELLSRLGLIPVRRVDGGAYLVAAPDELSERVIREILASEPRVREIEDVRELRLLETVRDGSHDEVFARARSFADVLAGEGPADLSYRWQPLRRTLSLGAVHRLYGAGVGVVAVIDTGVDPDHPELASSLVPGYDFVFDEPGIASEWRGLDPSVAAELRQTAAAIPDQSTVAILNQSTVAILSQSTVAILSNDEYPAFGHGTLVAGLIHFVAPRAKIMPLKAFRADGTSNTADIVEAIYYAVDHGADVINMSFSFESFSPEVMRAVNYGTRNGVVCVAAAGNLGVEALVYPASFENVTGVAGTTAGGERSPISNFGEDLVSVAAAGEEVLTTYPGGRYASVFGTSFSAAIVSGAVTLLLQVEGSIDQHDVENALAAGRLRDDDLGYGELDLPDALEWVRRTRSSSNDDDDDDERDDH